MFENLVDRRSDYSAAHVMKALTVLHEGISGREKLMKELGLGEATVKTLLRRLKKEKMVKAASRGHVLSRKGIMIVKAFMKNMDGPKRLGATSAAVSECNIAYLVRKKASKISRGIEQRDSAIMAGADGLTTFVSTKSGIMMPHSGKRAPGEISGMFRSRIGDVILVASAKDFITADIAALGAAMELLEKQLY